MVTCRHAQRLSRENGDEVSEIRPQICVVLRHGQVDALQCQESETMNSAAVIEDHIRLAIALWQAALRDVGYDMVLTAGSLPEIEKTQLRH